MTENLSRPSKGHHGYSGRSNRAPEYTVWVLLKARCLNPKAEGYHNYGGRGITVCDAWRNSFEQFLNDAGRRPSFAHSIDRIDNNRGYEPGNVRWATRAEQARNKTNNRVITIGSVTQCVADWIKTVDINPNTLRSRLRLGWTLERALSTPVLPRRATGGSR